MHDEESTTSIATEPSSVAIHPESQEALAAETIRIPVIEEVLAVDKQVVQRGGYRITKQITTDEEVIDTALRSETVQVERRPVGTLIEGDQPPAPRQEGDTLIVPVVKEVLVTEKRLMLVEEVLIRRVEATHREPQRVTLRKEEILIERLESDSSD